MTPAKTPAAFTSKPFANRKRKGPADYGIYRFADQCCVDITRRGQRLRKSFMHSTWGGEPKALKAARAWRDEIIAAAPAQYRRDIVQKPRSDSKGIPGVHCIRDEAGKPRMWLAKTQIAPGHILQRAFSVGRYGRKAQQMAISERARQLALMPLNMHTGTLLAEAAALVKKYRGEALPIGLEFDNELMTLPEIAPDLAHKRVKSGYSGVERKNRHDGRSSFWMARTRAGGVVQSKTFSIAKYGEGNAKKLAVEERRRQLRHAAGNLVTQEGRRLDRLELAEGSSQSTITSRVRVAR